MKSLTLTAILNWIFSLTLLAIGGRPALAQPPSLEVPQLKTTPASAENNDKRHDQTQAQQMHQDSGDEMPAKVLKIVERYQQAPAVHAMVTKKVDFAFTGKHKEYKGQVYFKKGQLRLQFSKPEKTLMVLNHHVLWIENHLDDPDFGDQIQVAKIKMGTQQKKNALLAFLFGAKDVWHHLQVLKESKGKGTITVDLKPLKKAQMPDIKKIQIVADVDKGYLAQVTYWDELDNASAFVFSHVNFKAHVAKTLFDYTPPKGVVPTEY